MAAASVRACKIHAKFIQSSSILNTKFIIFTHCQRPVRGLICLRASLHWRQGWAHRQWSARGDTQLHRVQHELLRAETSNHVNIL